MAPQKTAVPCSVSKWYKPDDEKKHFTRKNKKVARCALKKSISPG